jgi:hypothetical protein
VRAITFGDLTHTVSADTVWDARVGRFVYSRQDDPSNGNPALSSYFDRVTGITSSGAPQIQGLTLIRTTAKATVTHFEPDVFGADHEWKFGTQVERGEHSQPVVSPGGVRYVDDNGQPFQAISAAPSNSGGLFTPQRSLRATQ